MSSLMTDLLRSRFELLRLLLALVPAARIVSSRARFCSISLSSRSLSELSCSCCWAYPSGSRAAQFCSSFCLRNVSMVRRCRCMRMFCSCKLNSCSIRSCRRSS
uniref:(northern house mosquito) hypothetical protein n=1 Tax=Culex pipiens TaxID=7175 RepID=A0A8D8HU09_CULPI